MRPTVAHLKSGKKAGALDIEPEVAIQIIRSYCHVVKEPGWEARFCKRKLPTGSILNACLTTAEHNILPPTLTMLGMILQKNHVVHLRRLGDNLLICAATLGDLNAISRIVNRAFQAGKLDHPALLVPLTKLQFYANQGNVEAMVLYGRVLETKKKHDEAIEMFQRAAQFPRDPSTDSDVGEAFIQHGNILLGKGNKGDAKPYFKKAALEYDNAVGYSSLASLMSDEDPLKETYLLKAAASGIAEAGFQLAGFYHRTTELSAPLEKRQESKMITEKWLELGVFQGDEKSKAALKRLLDGEYSLDDESSSPQL